MNTFSLRKCFSPYRLRLLNLNRVNSAYYARSISYSNTLKSSDEKKDEVQDSPEEHTVQGVVSSLLFGSKKEQNEADLVWQSYSKLLRRGKYVHEIVFHHVKPDCVPQYADLISEAYPKVSENSGNLVKLVGSWKTVVGDLDTFVHIWEYEGYEGYDKAIQTLKSDEVLAGASKKILSTLRHRSSSINQEFSFWPTSPPQTLGGIFELRSYRLKSGLLLEWEQVWRKGLECRRQVMTPIGAWFCQIGNLQTVFHLWQFDSLQHRSASRDACWNIDGWAQTVHRTVPKIEEMKNYILKPLAYSPIK